MKTLILVLLLHLVSSEYYKETENFKYSRTSPEEGEKKGFYEAQSGNMGGNYEISRNMDTLAQRQHHGLRHQVGSQLGVDPLRMGSGAIQNGGPTSVYGSASTSGTVKGSVLADTQRTTNHGYDANQGYYSRNNYGTYRNGASGNSYTNDYDDSQRTIGAGDYSGTVNSQRGLETDSYRRNQGTSQSRLDSYGAESTANRYISGTSYKSSGSSLATDGTDSVRYESGHYIPKSTGVHSVGTSAHHTGTWDSETDVYSENTRGQARVPIPTSGVRVVPLNRGYTESHSSRNYESSVSRNAGTTRVGAPERTIPDASYTSNGHVSSADQTYEASSSQSYGASRNEQNTYGVQPGSTVKVVVRPNHPVKVQMPIQAQRPTVHVEGASTNQGIQSASHIHEAQRGETGSHNEDARLYGQSAGGKSVGSQNSYSYSKQWERHSTTGAQDVRGAQDAVVQPTSTNFQTAAQNRNNLLVGAVELDAESSGASRYQKGSHLDSSGTSFGSSSYNNQQASRHTTDYAAGRTQSGTGGLNTNYQTTQPKSYQTSYSYHKAWERHGDPYQILPSGETIPLTSTNAKGDMEGSASEGQASYVAGQHVGTSAYANAAQSRSSHGSAYAGDLQASMDSKLKEMQQNLQNQMHQQCPECGGTKSKGYRASYSYSAQRGYGGSEHTGGLDQGNHRAKRSPMQDQYASSEMEDVYGYLAKMERDIEKIVDDILGESHHWERKWSFDTDEDFPTMVINPTDYECDKRSFYNSHRRPYYVPYRNPGFFDIVTPVMIYFEEIEDEHNSKPMHPEEKPLVDVPKKTEDKYEDPKMQVEMNFPVYKTEENINSDSEADEVVPSKMPDDELYEEPQAPSVLQVVSPKRRRQSSYKHQKVEDAEIFDQQVEDLGQQTEDMGQQTEDMGQQTEDLGQQIEDLGPQIYGGLESGALHLSGSQPKNQRTNNEQQMPNIMQENEYFGLNKHKNQQSPDDFDQRSNVDQQTYDLGQQTVDFGQYGNQHGYPGPAVSSIMNENEFFGQKAVDDYYSRDVHHAMQTTTPKPSTDEFYKHHGKTEEERLKEIQRLQDMLLLAGGSYFNNRSRMENARNERTMHNHQTNYDQQNIDNNWEQLMTQSNKNPEVADQIKATTEMTTPHNHQQIDNNPYNQPSFLDTYIGMHTLDKEKSTVNNTLIKEVETFDEDDGQQVQQNVWEDLGQQTIQDNQQISQQNNYDDGQRVLLDNMGVNSQLNIGDKQTRQHVNIIEFVQTTTTEKPGFWRRTKDKVKGWFS